MKKYLLVHQEGTVPEELGERTVFSAKTAEEAISEIRENPDYSAVLVRFPSRIPEIRKLISHVQENNSDLLAVPILILTDLDRAAEDEKFLGGVVVDCIALPERQAVFDRRLANAEQLVSSVSFAEFSRMLRALPAIIYLKDTRGRYVFSSQTWHHLNTEGDPNWTIRGKTDLDIRKDKENARKALESDLELIRTGVGTSYIIEEKDQGQEFLQIIKEPLFREDGKVRGIIALINVVTEQEQLRRKLREQNITDQLTGLYSRSYYSEWIRKLEEDPPEILSVIAADCDRLKRINDTYGHLAGNDYIVACAGLLRECMPEGSLIFRTGGDEFVAFLPGSTAEEAEEMIREMRKREKFRLVRGTPLSVSFGASTMRAGGRLIQCIEDADNRMYQDKQQKHRP